MEKANQETLEKIANILKGSSELGAQAKSETELLSSTQQRLEQDETKMFGFVIVAVIAAVIIGMLLGTCIVMLCLNRYKNAQKSRLQQAGNHLQFTAGDQSI